MESFFADVAKAFGLRRVMVAASVLMTLGCLLRSGGGPKHGPEAWARAVAAVTDLGGREDWERLERVDRDQDRADAPAGGGEAAQRPAAVAGLRGRGTDGQPAPRPLVLRLEGNGVAPRLTERWQQRAARERSAAAPLDASMP